MLKKTIYGVVVSGFVAYLAFGSDVRSYAMTALSSVRSALTSEIDVAFETDRARQMVAELDPEIEGCLREVAEQTVEIEMLEKDILQRTEAADVQRNAIKTLKSDLSSSQNGFIYQTVSYTRDDVERDLSRRFSRFKATEAALARDQKILAAQRNRLTANEQKLDNMISQKQDLEVQVAELEARVDEVKATEIVSFVQIDDTRLSRTKELIRHLNQRLDVKEKMLGSSGRFEGLIPVGEPEQETVTDIVSEIGAYFGETAASSSEVVEPSA